ncbi:MAG: hypothetical protein HY673_03900 [Chloroflexi bacterium]|nr:hypothetical protein [Chloroflexota bacterium]
MFVRKFTRRRADGSTYAYLVMARTYREGKRVHQEEVCRLGNLDELQVDGQLDRLIRSLARFSRQRWVVADETGIPQVRTPSGLSQGGDQVP